MELITMSRAAERAASGKQGIFDFDEDSALAELKLAWADGGYRWFVESRLSAGRVVIVSGEFGSR
jgi:hypothetical protein